MIEILIDVYFICFQVQSGRRMTGPNKARSELRTAGRLKKSLNTGFFSRKWGENGRNEGLPAEEDRQREEGQFSQSRADAGKDDSYKSNRGQRSF